MNINAIIGDAGTEKTSSLNLLAYLLEKKGAKIESIKEFDRKTHLLIDITNDKDKIIGKISDNKRGGRRTDREYILKYNDKQMLIYTAGDMRRHITEAFLEAIYNEVDILFFACRTEKDLEIVFKIFEEKYKFKHIKKEKGQDINSFVGDLITLIDQKLKK